MKVIAGTKFFFTIISVRMRTSSYVLRIFSLQNSHGVSGSMRKISYVLYFLYRMVVDWNFHQFFLLCASNGAPCLPGHHV